MLLLRMGQGIFLGRGNLKALNQSELISRAVMLLGSLGLWATGRLDVATAIWTLLVAHGLASLYLLVQVRGEVRPRTLLDPALVRRMLGHGFVFASATILMIALGRVGIWIVSDLMGPAALGRYFGVQRLGEILVEVATAVGVVIFSHGVRAADIRASAGDAIRIARLVTALMAAVGLLCILAAQPLLRLTLGPEFAAEAPAFRLIMVGTLANCFTTMLFPVPLLAGAGEGRHRRLRAGHRRGGTRLLGARSAAGPRRRGHRLYPGPGCCGADHRSGLPVPVRLQDGRDPSAPTRGRGSHPGPRPPPRRGRL